MNVLTKKRHWIATLLLLAILATGCAQDTLPAETTLTEETLPTQSGISTGPEETLPAPTVPEDGDPDTIFCQGSYTGTEEQIVAMQDSVVASIGEYKLTNSRLHIYYWMEVAQYLAEHPEVSFDQPLDTLLCGLEGLEGTWQQYFLQRALSTWQSHLALYLMSGDVGLPTEEAYQPGEKRHADNLSEDLPALKYLYGYTHANFSPNELHQAYIADLPKMLQELAADAGYESLNALIQDLAGPVAAEDDLIQYSRLYNLAYSYFTSLSYEMDPTEEEIETWFQDHEEAYCQQGITRDSGYYVDMRHILFTSGDDPEACLAEAQTVFQSCQEADFDCADFTQLAYDLSDDAGSSLNGGLYSHISQGQLTDVLDAWCFDEDRQPGDVALLQTDMGYHIVWFESREDIWHAAAEQDLTALLSVDTLQGAVDSYPMEVRYDRICLSEAPQKGSGISADDILYPDVAHQRYPSPPLYLQQDYPTAYYGYYPLATHGCGITTMAMLASYMTDTEWTPPELAALYGEYCDESGTDAVLYDEVPVELGFQLLGRSSDWAEVWQALENGQVVVNLQFSGYWTQGGHFILMTGITEDDRIVVRDSNIYNYSALESHKIDSHDKSDIVARGFARWIFAPKVTRIPACARCSESTEGVATGMFTGEYICHKCQAALARRTNFVNACEAVK